jgi:hypothetical protein
MEHPFQPSHSTQKTKALICNRGRYKELNNYIAWLTFTGVLQEERKKKRERDLNLLGREKNE